MHKLFGTDGIRGIANEYPLTVDFCPRLVEALVSKFCSSAEKKHSAIIGKDTRISGDMLEHSLAAAFCAEGIDVTLLGVVPTPAVSILTRELEASIGVMVTASHNPFYDNGIKLFNGSGSKLLDSEEAELEKIIDTNSHLSKVAIFDFGRVEHTPSLLNIYSTKIKNSLNFKGSCKIVVDCANGSFSAIAPDLLRGFGFEVISIYDSPNGVNINENCGAANPDALRKAVFRYGADIGIAFDGDGDRIVLADECGNFLDGDHILAILIQSEPSKEVVSTIMSNLGLEKYLASIGIKLHRSAVGDRYISQYMQNSNAQLGAESSGHVIVKSHASTGDGLFAALKVLEYLIKSGKICSQLRFFEPYPTVSRNLHVQNKSILQNPAIQRVIQEFEKRLGGHGRLVVRPSGTEPVIRIWMEGENATELEEMADELSLVISDFFG
ncbi:MAG: phosphoglucosamine mutase [Holosporaceae bacterium]|jgi:phosphoglucosamine mutase|nr:phosphoglucosamine mutase [Holosporaceae bacterium]